MWLLSILLKKLMKRGRLTIIDHRGRSHLFEGAPSTLPSITLRLHDAKMARDFSRDPEMAAGEGYMNGRYSIEGGDVRDFLNLVMENLRWERGNAEHQIAQGTRRMLKKYFIRMAQMNDAMKAKRNVAHHYDLSATLYDLFLDADRQYSCAYFPTPDATLEQAQLAKKAHIAAKLLLQPGHSVLDIGCGWGGMALYLNRVAGAHAVGVTLSEEQLAVAQRRALDGGVADQVKFRLQDYRAVPETFDRIVSVGMFEHVGLPQYQTFFDKVHSALKPDGVALLHTIGRADGPGTSTGWVTKYIFPGGYAPALSEILPAIERAGLYVTDIEVLRLHYAETLRHWYERFQANRDRVKDLYDERFCRMWEFYLASSEHAFRYTGHVVFQIQLARRVDAVPITRDYQIEAERALLAKESQAPLRVVP